MSIGTAETATNCEVASSSAAAADCEANGIIEPLNAAIANRFASGLRRTNQKHVTERFGQLTSPREGGIYDRTVRSLSIREPSP
jgi:hypothetical protein